MKGEKGQRMSSQACLQEREALHGSGDAGEKAVQETSRLSRWGRLYIPGRKQPENCLRQTDCRRWWGKRTEAVRHKHPQSYDMCDHLCFLPWHLNATLLLPAQISLVIRPPTLPLSDLSNHPGETVKSQPLLPAVHPTHPLRSPPPAQGVDFWKCTSADDTPV